MFFNLFFEAESFATILIAHRTSCVDSLSSAVAESQMSNRKAVTSN